MSTVPIEFHFSNPFLNSARRNTGRKMLYNDVNDLRQAFAATPVGTITAPVSGAVVPPGGVIPMAGNTSSAGAGPSVRGPPPGQAIPVMPQPVMMQKSGGIMDTIKQHKILVIAAVVALLLIIGIIILLFRRKKRSKRR